MIVLVASILKDESLGNNRLTLQQADPVPTEYAGVVSVPGPDLEC